MAALPGTRLVFQSRYNGRLETDDVLMWMWEEAREGSRQLAKMLASAGGEALRRRGLAEQPCSTVPMRSQPAAVKGLLALLSDTTNNTSILASTVRIAGRSATKKVQCYVNLHWR